MINNVDSLVRECMKHLENDGFFTEESDNGFIQASKNTKGGFIVEYQDSEQNHYQARNKNITLIELTKILRQYLSDSKSGEWRRNIAWDFLENFSTESPIRRKKRWFDWFLK